MFQTFLKVAAAMPFKQRNVADVAEPQAMRPGVEA